MNISDMQRLALGEELVRVYNECEDIFRHLFLSLAGEHPLKFSPYTMTLSVWSTFDQSYTFFVEPLKKRLRGKIPIPLAKAVQVWKRTYDIMQKLQVAKEIGDFVLSDQFVKSNPFLPPTKLDPAAAKTVQTLTALAARKGETLDISQLPAWAFSDQPWTPETATPGDPLMGLTKTDCIKFGELASCSLNVLRVLCDHRCTDVDAAAAFKVFDDAYPLNRQNPRRRKKRKTPRAAG